MALTEWQQQDAENAWEAAKHLHANPIPLAYIAGALAHYKADRDKAAEGHDCNDSEFFPCPEGDCVFAPVEVEHSELVAVKQADPICPDDVWAVEIKYNSRNNHFVMGVTADGRYNLYQD